MDRFHFPSWVNRLVILIGLGAGAGVAYGAFVYAYFTLPTTLNVGYMPEQPVPFSHRVHAGDLKFDCRYCHNTVEDAAHAAIPPTSTCIKCHSGVDASGSTKYTAVFADSLKLAPVRQSFATGEPVEWERVHDLADYVYFNHAAHVNRGVGCVECHGRIDTMDQVWQDKSLSMGFCLDCHRDPVPRLRPQSEITNLAWTGGPDPNDPASMEAHRQEMEKMYPNINASTNCSTCHR
ncbi:cytochrome c3 family protein [Aeoliella mucimassa]|uniref:Class III cytochrome C family protein n=1 Tax=Aeoliella mucimassa TaxID=2527972 RepID=A0A518AGZ3_9BACT|nr:cytochrome c3 family protein [Aeoliella mucimassa]QDU53996.1 Class III cytochrome C family protein [Aeoliella mucimassa]